MEYLVPSKNSFHDFSSKYSTHLSSCTQFPQIRVQHSNLQRNNLTKFYPEHGSLKRSNTNYTFSRKNELEDPNKPTIIPIFKLSDQGPSLRTRLKELEGLKVPEIYSSSRNSLYVRYTINDWMNSSQNMYGNSDRIKGVSEKVRNDSLRLGREFDDRTNKTETDSRKKLNNRILDVNSVKLSLNSEIEEIISETEKLNLAKIATVKALKESENPLHIAEECIYNREKRSGIDLVHDIAEKELLKEMDVIKNCQDKMMRIIQKSNEQIRLNQNALHELENDARNKFHASKIDQLAHSFNNSSTGLAFYNGIEYVNNCMSTPETWMKFSNSNLNRSAREREASTHLREDIERCLNECKNDMEKQWQEVNNALSKRIQETSDARNRDQAYLKNILQEMFDMEKNIEYLKKSILDKEAPLKLAESRLYVRLDRPKMEACNDIPKNKLVEEVEEIKTSVNSMKTQLRVAERTLQNLLINKSDIEEDLNLKTNSLFIDREKCLGIRKSFFNSKTD